MNDVSIDCYEDPKFALWHTPYSCELEHDNDKHVVLVQVRINPLFYTEAKKTFNSLSYTAFEIDEASNIRPYALCLYSMDMKDKILKELNELGDKGKFIRKCELVAGSCAIPLDFEKTKDLFDRYYDYDFTEIKDKNTKYAGQKEYLRPCGALRIGVKVAGKYPDDDWLSSSWHNAYHGTKPEYVTCILENGFKIGPRKQFGVGIYCTPSPSVALGYSRHKKETALSGKSIVVMQVRVDPSKYKVVADKDFSEEYWLVEDETGIRTYGICLFPKK